MPIDMTGAQVVECKRILRGAGYSHAWVLDSTDSTERVFLVPESDLDWGVGLCRIWRTLGLGWAYRVAADKGDEHRLDGGVPGNQGFHRRL